MLGYGVDLDLSVLCHGIHLDLLGVLYELADHYGVLLRNVGSQTQEAFKLVGVGADVHSGSRKHVARAHEHRIANFVDKLVDILEARQLTPARLIDSDAVEHCGELVAVLGVVDAARRCAEYVDVLVVEACGEVVGYLSSHREDDSVGLLKVEYVHDTLECQLVEVEAVAEVVVGRYGFGVVVDHHRSPAFFLDGEKCVDRAPVELHGAADAVGSRSEDYDRPVVVEIVDVVFGAVVCEVEVVGACGIFGGERVDLLDDRGDAEPFAQFSHLKYIVFGIGHGVLEHAACYLEVGESLLLGLAEKRLGDVFELVAEAEFVGCADDVGQTVEEPAVDLCEFVYAFDAVAFHHGLCDDEDAFVGRLGECMVDVGYGEFAVAGESVHALSDHA